MSRARRVLQSFRGCEAGAAAVEFALVSVAMILVVLGVIEFGRGFYVRNELSYAVDLGARKVLTSSSISEVDLKSTIRSGFTVGDSDLLEVDIGNEVVGGIAFRRIAVSYPFTLLVPGLSSKAISLSVDRRVPLV